jgi:hypothetical protein
MSPVDTTYLLMRIGCMDLNVRNVSFEEIGREAFELGHIIARAPLAMSHDQHLLDVEPLFSPKN